MNFRLLLHNPIWLRDLRLIVRSRSFLLPFFGQHLFFVFFICGQLLMPTSAQSAESIGTFLWTVACIYNLIVIPLTALNSISDELQDGRGELVLLTQLTASDIVYGKWLAHGTLSLLVLCSNLPYSVMRTYFGRYELLTELILLGLLWAGSLLICAIAVCLSAYLSRILKLLIFLFFVLFGFGTTMDALRGRTIYGLNLQGDLPAILLVLFLILAPFAVLLLEFGVLRLRSAVENRYSLIRFLGLYLMWALTVANGFAPKHEILLLFLSILGAFLVLESWSQPCLLLPWIYRPFVRFGWMGRWAGRFFFYPGWPSGLFYTWLILHPMVLSFCQHWNHETIQILATALAIWLIILLPAGISLLLQEKYPQCRGMKFYAMVQIAGFGSMGMLAGLTFSLEGLEFLALVPWVGLFYAIAEVTSAQFLILVAYPLLFLALWICLYVKRTMLARRITACETEALAELGSNPS